MTVPEAIDLRLHPLFSSMDRWIPTGFRDDPEAFRRGRLITRFGLLGSIFGLVYATLYLLIGHEWGAEIILACTIAVVLTPPLMFWSRSIQLAGHFLALILTLGFFSLCCVEGGMHGHALAWLVSVPLCALLLLGERGAAIWLSLAFLAAAFIVGCDLAGIPFRITYPPQWEPVVTGAGYLGLVLFMSILGLIFESGRAHAHARTEAALGKLRESNERLVGLNQEKSDLLGIVAHDLKNPLMVIMANGDLMRYVDDPSRLHDFAEKIMSASERMNRLILDVLDINAIEESHYSVKLKSCDVRQLVGQILEQNGPCFDRKQIRLLLRSGPEVFVETDTAATLQILDNLISNAVKYSPPRSTVRIRITTGGNRALVMVRDEGPGISGDDQKKLFQKYSRLTARPTGGESSNGLGLSIAKRLAQLVGGDVLCRSRPGVGTIFALRLPLSSGYPAVNRAEMAATPLRSS